MQNTEYIENYLFLQKLPFAEKLLKENNKLKKKNKELRSLVKLITKNIDVFEKPIIDTSKVYIKQEKNSVERVRRKKPKNWFISEG